VSPRALEAEVVAEAARALGLNVVVAPSVADAVATARAAVPDDGLLVAAGSLYVVAEARQLLLEQTAAGSALPPA
jgi:dihydrofolate synthase / folylpolyglutamate synthase